MPKSIFVSYVYEDLKHRDDVKRWAAGGLLGPGVVVSGESGDYRQLGATAVENHLKPLINGAAAVLLLLGKDTHSHEWVRYELAVATSLNKKIIIAQIPGTVSPAPEGLRLHPVVLLDPSAIRAALG